MSSSLRSVNHFPAVALWVRFFTVIRLVLRSILFENPLVWRWARDSNPQTDIEGPLYIPYAPYKEVELGKGLLAPLEMMEVYGAFLLSGKITSKSGQPIGKATFDIWQADGTGSYCLSTYGLRGKLHTDKDGRFEILSIAPKGYVGRAPHFHFKVYTDDGKYKILTSQVYACDHNSPKEIENDIAGGLIRKQPHHLVLDCWALAEGPKANSYPNKKESELDSETQAALKWWNKKLENEGFGHVKVTAGAPLTFSLLG